MKPVAIRWGQKILETKDRRPAIINAMFGSRREALEDLGFGFNAHDWRAGYKSARKHGYRVIRISVREHMPRRKPR